MIQMYSCDKYARHRLLGEAELSLVDLELHSGIAVRLWLNLHEMDQVRQDTVSQFCQLQRAVINEVFCR